MHVTKPAQVRRLQREVPVSFLLFDVLWLDGRALLGAPYAERRGVLEGLGLTGPCWATPPAFEGDGADVLAASRAQGLEGIVSKHRDSRYAPGRRSDRWVKVKNVRTQETVIVGWKPGEGRRAGRIGSLLLAVNADDGLRYAGHVGTGFSEDTLDDLSARLHALRRDTSPLSAPVPREHARDAHWVQPELVAEVAYGEWTRDGRLRHPSYRGLRPDRDPGEVVRES
jgi:bifunctional non-homologous end joining protein LigD